MSVAKKRTKTSRIELRATPSERRLIEMGAHAANSDMTRFVVQQACEAAQRLLADRTVFPLSQKEAKAWDSLNEQPARNLPGLSRLMARRSPFQK